VLQNLINDLKLFNSIVVGYLHAQVCVHLIKNRKKQIYSILYYIVTLYMVIL